MKKEKAMEEIYYQEAMKNLSLVLRLPLVYVEAVVGSLSKKPYFKYSKKKSSGVRWIYAPCLELKKVQACLKDYFNHWSVDDCIYGFRRGRSIRDNALTHCFSGSDRAPRWKLKLDLRDAFPSIKRQYLQVVFYSLFQRQFKNKKNGIPRLQAWVKLLLDLTTYDDHLIQGSPTSPTLLNRCLVYSKVPQQLIELSKKRERPLWLSIYADDITITSQRTKIKRFELAKIIKIIESNVCFKVNSSKTRLTNRKNKSHQITGVVLAEIPTGNDRYCVRATIPQSLTRSYRGKIHRAIVLLNNDQWPNKHRDGLTTNQVKGFICHAKFVCDHLPSGLSKVVVDFENALYQYGERNKIPYQIV